MILMLLFWHIFLWDVFSKYDLKIHIVTKWKFSSWTSSWASDWKHKWLKIHSLKIWGLLCNTYSRDVYYSWRIDYSNLPWLLQSLEKWNCHFQCSTPWSKINWWITIHKVKSWSLVKLKWRFIKFKLWHFDNR